MLLQVTVFNPGRQLAVSLDYPTVPRHDDDETPSKVAASSTAFPPRVKLLRAPWDALSCSILKILCTSVDRGSGKRVKLCRDSKVPAFHRGDRDCPAWLFGSASRLLLNF